MLSIRVTEKQFSEYDALIKLSEREEKQDFNLYEDLYGHYVQMNDRFETVHIWNKEVATRNQGRWIPLLITKEKYDSEMKESWNN